MRSTHLPLTIVALILASTTEAGWMKLPTMRPRPSSPTASKPISSRAPPATMATSAEPKMMKPASFRVTHSALPVLSYSGLAAMTLGAVKFIGASWASAALLGWTIGLPVGFVLLSSSRGGASVAKSMGGRPADAELTAYAHEAAKAVGVAPPEAVFEVPAREPNAFAASNLLSKSTTVAVTSGLRAALTPTELKAVLAHEMGHLQASDVVRNMHLAATIAGFSGLYQTGRILLQSESRKSSRRSKSRDKEDSGGGAAAGLALMGAGLGAEAIAHGLRLAASRDAELRADRAAAQAFGANSIISALKKIDRTSARAPADLRESSTGKAFAFAMISGGATEPANAAAAFGGGLASKGSAKGGKSLWTRLGNALRTHPPLDERVAALEKAAAAGVVPAKDPAAYW